MAVWGRFPPRRTMKKTSRPLTPPHPAPRQHRSAPRGSRWRAAVPLLFGAALVDAPYRISAAPRVWSTREAPLTGRMRTRTRTPAAPLLTTFSRYRLMVHVHPALADDRPCFETFVPLRSMFWLCKIGGSICHMAPGLKFHACQSVLLLIMPCPSFCSISRAMSSRWLVGRKRRPSGEAMVHLYQPGRQITLHHFASLAPWVLNNESKARLWILSYDMCGCACTPISASFVPLSRVLLQWIHCIRMLCLHSEELLPPGSERARVICFGFRAGAGGALPQRPPAAYSQQIP